MNDWRKVELSSVAHVFSGDGAPQETTAFGDTGVPFVRAGSLAPLLDGMPEQQLELICEPEAKKRRMEVYPPETVLFAKSGVSCTMGLIYQLRGRAHVVNHLAAVICGNELYPRFLLRWLQVNSPARFVANESYPSIRLSDIRAMEIPLPPLAEQKRIAHLLDAADDLRAKRRQTIALTDAFLQAVFLDMFGDPIHNPKNWPTALFGDCVADATKHAPKIPKAEYPSAGKWQIIDQSQMAIAGYADSDAPFANPLPVVVFGDHTRCVKLIRAPFVLGADGTKILVPGKDMNADYLAHLLLLLRLPDLGYSRHTRELKRRYLPLPPLPLQQRFADIAQKTEAHKAQLRAHARELDTLFAALQQQAFGR